MLRLPQEHLFTGGVLRTDKGARFTAAGTPWKAAGELDAKRTFCAVCPALLSKQPHSPLQSSPTHMANFQVAHATVEDTSSSHLPQLTHQQRQHVFASGRLCSTTKTDACAFQ